MRGREGGLNERMNEWPALALPLAHTVLSRARLLFFPRPIYSFKPRPLYDDWLVGSRPCGMDWLVVRRFLAWDWLRLDESLEVVIKGVSKSTSCTDPSHT